MKEPDFLTSADVLRIHAVQVELFGGEGGIRDRGLLESALAMPRAGIAGEYFHADLFEMAAALLYHIVRNHPFVDGNKRTGIVAALLFLELNGIEVACGNDELADFVYALAQGEVEKDTAARFFRRHASNLEQDRNGNQP